MSNTKRDPRRWFLIAMLIVMLHAVFYAVAIPPWDLFDEEQHLDYVLTIRDDRRVPYLSEFVRLSIVRSAVDTDRWTVFRIGEPPSDAPEEMGLEGRSFEGYQPPLYYATVVPLTVPAGDRALPALYLGRALGVPLLMVFAATAWALARRWFPDSEVWAPFSAAVITGAIPAAAEAAGRVNNDLMAATLISLGLLSTLRLIDRPTTGNALIAGLVAAAAILTKSPGLISLGLLTIALWLIWRREKLSLTVIVATLAPGTIAFLLWTAFIYGRYETLTGSTAFLRLVVPFSPLPVGEFLVQVWLNGWSSYWSAYDGGWLRILIGLVSLGLIAGALYGVCTGKRTPRIREGLLFTGLLGAALLAVLWVGNISGLVHPHGRIILPVYPALAALTAGGWTRLRHDAALVPAIIACLAALISAGFWFLPFFYGATS